MAGSTPASVTAEPRREAPIARVLAPGEAPGQSGGPGAASQAELGKEIRSVSPWAEAWRRFRRHRLAYWSLWILAALVLAVLIGPLAYKVGINEIDFKARLAGPSLQHPFGTRSEERRVGKECTYRWWPQ